MRNIKLVIEYDGTKYCGWQSQKNGISIEDTLKSAIKSIINEDIKLIGSSRTDAGVHAKGQVANFYCESNIPTERLPFAINSKLPHDIVVLKAEDMPLDFHARYSSLGKRYSYTIFQRKIPPALMRSYVAFCPYELNYDLMRMAGEYFLGTKDFSAFKSSGSSVKTSVRTIRYLEFEKYDNIIRFEIEADGFLYNMVRIIAGTLIDVGIGKIEPEDIESIIESKNRKRAGRTAPASGLCLEKVYYKNDDKA
ncbi:tRNA pseudouridine(38-40) synthase TruA [Caloramator sp. E03]|uniref:tRNA pseudouridine(38-40) synthase TruA n=1 Tax=Caloramator sp. E03 TaxID=2576307 RepID=UPI0011105801|nr:tRNA pseudouridine(38-40) synthase TruA [Caloramator sp. E03]QCX34828.1 tRNA pseudouridine(38-40) synthase TruA [Caloramator sp. E03]